MSEPVVLEVFTDYVCPWCYLGDNRVKRLKKNYDIEVKIVHFPLHPDTPQEGRTLQDMFGTGPEDIEAKNNHMKDLMGKEGLPYNTRSHTYNSRLAQEIGSWAETQRGGNAIHDKFFEAYFVNTLNVGDVGVIINIVKSVGLDEHEAQKILEDRTFKDAVDADWQKSHSYGVTGVPTFVSAGQGLVGAQSYGKLEHLIKEVGAKKLF
jgi:predicted DsbA family dithiol-disulfide isomerase